MTGKQRIREILNIKLEDEGTQVLKLIDVNQALDSIEEVFKDCIGEAGVHSGTYPLDETVGYAITYSNQRRSEQLGRWESK